MTRVSDDTANPVYGILLMLAGFLAFTVLDAQTKVLVEAGYHPVFISWGRLLLQLLMIVPFILQAGGLPAMKTRRPGAQTVRGVALTIAGISFVAGLAFLPLATMTAISFISPFIISILAVIFLREHVGLHRWAAIVIGFMGVLVVIRPGTEGFHPAALFALLSALCWAVNVIATRIVQGHDSPLVTLFYTCVIGILITSAIVWLYWPKQADALLWLLAGSALASLLGQMFTILALRHAAASALAPLSYSQLVWAAVLGIVLFGNFPDAWTWAGTVIIVGSGLYVWHRERRLAAPTSMPVPNRLGP